MDSTTIRSTLEEIELGRRVHDMLANENDLPPEDCAAVIAHRALVAGPAVGVCMTGATGTRISGDLIAGLALLHAYDEGGHHLAGAAIAHLLVDPNAPETNLRDQLATLTLEANSLAQGLARVSHAWDQTEQAAVERRELGRLRVHASAPVRWLGIGAVCLAVSAVVTGVFVGAWTLIGWAVTR